MNRYFKIMIVAALAMFTGLIAQTVTVSISDAGDNYLELYMINTEAVGGFQFTLGDDPEAFSLTGAAGGSAAAAGFLMSTSPEGLVLGFSLTGSTIPAGEGVLCTVAFNPSGDYTHITIDSAIISDPFGGSYETLIDQPGGFWEWGEPTVEPQAVTINAPMEGETVYGMDIDVSVSAMHLIEGDHFHAYLDGSLEGMYYTDSFTLMGVAYGPHTLTVTVADMNHVDYENPEATDTVNFENAEQTLEGYTLYLGDVEVLAGETVDVPLSLDNEDIVGGFQLQIMDFPDYADVVAVSTTDRTAGFSTSFNEQIDGSVLIVGFDLTLTGVTPGTGPILNIAYLSTGIYDSEINLSMITGASIISDLIGNPLPFDSENGSITVDGLDAPDVFAPENLNAVGGFSMINLLWTHPEPWDVVEYYIYRDGDIVGTATATNYTDTGLITEQTYCYTVVAVSEFNTSEHSNEACATTLAQFFEPPENLTAEENGLEVNLTWYPPASVNVCGDEVVGALPFSTVGSNSGHSDDWAVQGSNGADVAYLFNVSQPITIDVTLCTPDTDYDTKLEIFTADADCNETTTGYYDDDATCQYSVLYSSLFGVSLQPGSYYIVVDGYGGQEGNYGLEISESGALASLPPSIEESMSVESAKSGIEYTLETWDIADNETPTREFVGYEVYRDNQLLEFTTNNFYTDTDGLWYLQTYCYNVTAVYDDPGTSGFSNTACATPQLGEPSNLSAHGEGDFVRLNWLPHPDNAQTSFYVYRDGEFLAESTDPTYDDSDTVHDTEYCYTVTAYYDGTGESPATNEACSMWSLCPPAHLAAEAGDGYVDLTWDETSCGEEVFLQYSTNLLDNAFYFYDTYENGFAHGMRFDVGTDFDVLSASVYILSEGDQYWPWPNSTHGPVTVMVFDDAAGFPGEMLYSEEVTAVDGWATVNPNLNGLSGSFHVIASHAENWSTGGDPEGFGIDEAVDYPNNMMTLQNGAWSSGDVLNYGGDYMMAALVNAQGYEAPLVMDFGDLPSTPYEDYSSVVSVHDGTQGNGGFEVNPAPFYPSELTRELLSYNITRDGAFLVNLAPDVFAYTDMDVTNMNEYCYSMTGVYTEGESDPTGAACAEPIPGNHPTDLTAEDMGGIIHLDWTEPAPFEGPVLNYNVYRDDEFYDASATSEYDDTEPVAGIEYCYHITAVYASGESYPSNQACATYVLNPPVGVMATGMDDAQGILVTWNTPGSLAFLTIEILTDTFGGEVSWELTAEDGTLIDSITGGSLSSNTFYEWEEELTPGTYTFSIHDSFGDGICCSYGEGYYNLILNETIIATGGDYGSGENVTFDTSDALLSISQTWYTQPVPFEKGTELTETQISELEIGEPVIVFENTDRTERVLLHYEVFRDGDYLAQTDLNTLEYFDEYPSAMNDTEYCYHVIAVYDEGNSVSSNTSCDHWALPAPSGLMAIASGSSIELSWTAAPSNDVIEYMIYRDGEFLDSTPDVAFVDETTEHDVLYCYQVKALFDLGESGPTNQACAMWMILPPAGLTAEAGNHSVHLEWFEPLAALCADEVIPGLPFTGQGSNVGLENDWDVQGTDGADFAYGLYIPTTTTINVDLCSALTDYDCKVEIFTADLECVATTTGYYDDDGPFGTCDESPANYTPSLIENANLTEGQYYIVVDGFSGAEGNYEINVYETGAADGAPADINESVSYEAEKSGLPLTIEDWDMAIGPEREDERPLTAYNIYRDGEPIDSVGPDVFEYDDTGLTNLTEYCYYVTAQFDEGESPASNVACAIPIPGLAPTGLTVISEGSNMNLDWQGVIGDLVEYNVYRDGEFLAAAADDMYVDTTAEHDVLYCYTVTAMYTDGESQHSNEACGMWMILPPQALTAEAGNHTVHLEWMEPATNLCADETIPSLPFFAEGSNVGMSNDWDIQASDGADVAYSLYLPVATTINLHTCWEGADFDTKLEIFTADLECVGTTTGYYDDDDACALTNELVSGIYGAFLDAGQYYIVVDGFGGQEGAYGLTVEDADALAEVQPPADMMTALEEETVKSGLEYTAADWNEAGNVQPRENERPLTGYNIYRDGEPIATVDPGVYEYDDTGLTNLTQYCYHVTAQFDEGESPVSNEACATPIPGLAPANLAVMPELGSLNLDWDPVIGDVLEYNVYKDGELYVSLTADEYLDTDTVNDVLYCYVVTAVYPDGESQDSNEACGQWSLDPVVAWIEVEGYETLEVAWSEPGIGGLCADEQVTALPFTHIGSNVGMGDDWPVQGGQGDDVAYGLYWPEDGALTVTLCSENTDYDTKLEIFTADADCVPTTTGNYDDDGPSCPESPATFAPSELANVFLTAGTYYIVVDGFSGATGNYEITISESNWEPGDCAADAPYDSDDPCYIYVIGIDPYCCDFNWDTICEGEYQDCVGGDQFSGGMNSDHLYRSLVENAAYESEKSGTEISIEDWTYANNPSTISRVLTGFEISRDDDGVIAEVGPNTYSYVDTDLENGTEYCYEIVAVYEEGDAPASNPACGIPTAAGLCVPENFQIEIEAGITYAGLSWTIPGGCGQDGFNIYRDGQFLASVGAGTFEYNDSDLTYWQEYCWYVKASYGDQESNPSETYCGAVPDIGDFSVLSTDFGEVAGGEEITISVNLANQFEVAGFQMSVVDVPDLLTVTNVVSTPRTSEADGWAIQSNEQVDGSVIIVGFNLLGGTIEVGEGAILEITFLAAQVLLTTDVMVYLNDAFLGDPFGTPLPMYTEFGIITIVPPGAVELFVHDMDMAVGEEDAMPVSMTNEQPVYGFQLTITHSNPIAHMIDVVTTDRTAGWMISGSPQTGVLIGFNLTGTPIDAGEGPILNINMGADTEGEDEMCMIDIILSDANGLPLPAIPHCGMMTVTDGPVLITQQISLSPFMNNLFSFNVLTDDQTAETILGDAFFIAWNANGGFYVPSFGIDQINEMNVVDGYGGFISGTQPITLEIEGTAASLDLPIIWSAFMNNMFSYLPQVPMSSVDAFSAYADNILIISNDAGEFYVPSLGVNTIDMLYPGEGYKVFVSGPNAIEFFYPQPVGLTMDAGPAMIRDYQEASRSDQYSIVETGMPYAIVITAADGAIQTGDELVAYADGQVVGATKVVDLNQPIVLTAWEGYDEYGISLPGFTLGDEIDLRLYSAAMGEELRVAADLDADYYGVTPLSSGSITVYEQAAIPTEYTLGQNFPNPFNPNTTIEFSVPDAGRITVNVYDIMGRQIRTLVDGNVTKGYHQVIWDGMDSTNTPVSAGMYIYALQGEGVSLTRKMVMMK